MLGHLIDASRRHDEPGQARERKVEANRLFKHETVATPIFRRENKPAGDRIRWCWIFIRSASQQNFAAGANAPRAEQVHQQFGASGPHESSETEHFARVEIKRDVVEK